MIRAILALALVAGPAAAVECERQLWSEVSFLVCKAEAGRDDVRLFHKNGSGEPFGDFGTIEKEIGPLEFAMNAGMFHRDLSAVGLLQIDGLVVSDIVLQAGPGNFGMLPNGVFCIADGAFRVVESHDFRPENCRDATQSGPMLVIEGRLHPRFISGGASKFVRNGVGTSHDSQNAYFVLSEEPVNFDTFARFFRDALSLDNALYFDGNVSRVLVKQLNTLEFGRPIGPIVGVLED